MSSKKHPALRLELHNSNRLVKLIAVIHVMALAATLINSLAFSLKCALFLVVVSHFYFQLKHLAAKPCYIEQTETGWKIAVDDIFEDIQILPSTVVSTVAIFLHFKKDDKSTQSLVIFSDALAEDDYRCLIVRLKITLTEEQNCRDLAQQHTDLLDK